MKKILANVLALVGGVWTGLCGTLLMGLLWSVAADPYGLTAAGRGYYAPQLAGTASLLSVGLVLLWAGLRIMKNSTNSAMKLAHSAAPSSQPLQNA
jgi:hypothetical protein